MAATTPQTFANHTRWDPQFHFFIVPVFVLGLILTLVHFFAHITEGDMRDHIHSFLLILLALTFLTWIFKTRLYALKVQDRIIRLEERLRLMQLLPEGLRRAFRKSPKISVRTAPPPMGTSKLTGCRNGAVTSRHQEGYPELAPGLFPSLRDEPGTPALDSDLWDELHIPQRVIFPGASIR
jgi:hypothetical protein